ncbi:PREDICTED: uncharacterized protein LOC104758797 [Camelina sativa]|uniref:Uncharacterized protein LOC104758797 n=1 Tax=Camelina sativa TaxID=90675 RepID=A0ABM1R7K8_CAMSA|nr:PREDICTED: uncharacterized protein LOC104758797 [Camelina sativa]
MKQSQIFKLPGLHKYDIYVACMITLTFKLRYVDFLIFYVRKSVVLGFLKIVIRVSGYSLAPFAVCMQFSGFLSVFFVLGFLKIVIRVSGYSLAPFAVCMQFSEFLSVFCKCSRVTI